MTRYILAILAIAWNTIVANAQASSQQKEQKLIPPIEYDKPYTGELIVTRLASQDEIRAACAGAKWINNVAIGCNKRTPPRFMLGEEIGGRCQVYIATDEILKLYGVNFELVLRHEIGHCNGWGEDHAGARAVEPPLPRPRPIPTTPTYPLEYFWLPR